MASDIRSYSLWLQHITTRSKTPKPGGISVTQFQFVSNNQHGAGAVGAGKANFDGLELTITDDHAYPQFSIAQSSGVPLGRGRLDAILTSGCSRPVLEFESTLVTSVLRYNVPTVGSLSYTVQLAFENPRLVWQPVGR